MQQALTKKMVTGLVIGCLTLSFGAIALANDSQQKIMPNPEIREQYINTSIDNLVNEGTITQDQATKLISFLKEQTEQRESEMGKMRSMTPKERDTYHQQKFNQHPDLIKELKDIAGLSDEQAKAVADVTRPPHRPSPEGGPRCPMTQNP